MSVGSAYAEVHRVTRREAKSFAYGIMVLPREKRRAIEAIYAFAREVDDIADGTLPADEKRRRLTDLHAELATIAAASPEELSGRAAWAIALADARRRYAIPLDALHALVDGGLQDLDQQRYEDFDDLVGYCRKVAGAVGLACLPVYRSDTSGSEPQSPGNGRARAGSGGASGSEPQALAERLGVALQLINILRDVEEDGGLGRVYLPQDELAAFGVSEADLAAGRVTDGWRRLAAFQAERARGWLSDGLGLLGFLDRRSALCVRTFAGIYAATLDEIEARGYDVFDGEVRPSTRAKLAIVARGLLA
jgi:15-cis-phytoene synthase